MLIVSGPCDVHLPLVTDGIRRRGREWLLLDLASVPNRVPVTVGHQGANEWGASLLHSRARVVQSTEVVAVWWRRPTPYLLPASVPERDRPFVSRQLNEAMIGFWSALDATWVNDPWSDQRATHKLLQLHVARGIGFEIPRTTVTTRVEEARQFLSANASRRIVLKLLAVDGDHCPPTRFVELEEGGNVETASACPVILQAYVPGVDIRATVVGDDVFAAAIDARRTSSPEDFRPVYSQCQVQAHDLEDQEKWMIVQMSRRLGLVYAAFDFRRTDEGRLVFLEVNPAGQWLFVEHRTRQPISDAMAAALCSETGSPKCRDDRKVALQAA